jgi:hypothetical protein
MHEYHSRQLLRLQEIMLNSDAERSALNILPKSVPHQILAQVIHYTCVVKPLPEHPSEVPPGHYWVLVGSLLGIAPKPPSKLREGYIRWSISLPVFIGHQCQVLIRGDIANPEVLAAKINPNDRWRDLWPLLFQRNCNS